MNRLTRVLLWGLSMTAIVVAMMYPWQAGWSRGQAAVWMLGIAVFTITVSLGAQRLAKQRSRRSRGRR
ncbi:hypothetical protein ACYSUO_36950 [Streptomyces sp. UC4497]